MKSILLCVMLALLIGCSEPTAPVETEKSVTLSFVSASENILNLQLINGSEKSIFYYGFSRSSPLQQVEILTDTGWACVAWYWCATGAERLQVKPHETATIESPLMRRNVKTRVRFWYQVDGEEDSRLLFSNEFYVQ
jgi:hypothetical protein